jgi:hypothetical protein
VTWLVAAIWLVHGVYNKLLGGSERHLQIVQAVPGLDGATGVAMLTLVGVVEVALAGWIISRRAPRTCAATQTVLLLSMNVAELTFARHLLLWPAGLIPLNLAFLALAWTAAGWRGPARLLARLKRHPMAIDAHFHDCLTLTYAVPEHVLRPLLSRGLELDTFRGFGFVAVALVQAADLRPAGLPAAMGQDFFLAGYRIFTRFRRQDGRSIRGLRILRSDTNKARMVAGGNLLTHYNYHRCDAAVDASPERIRVSIDTPDHGGDLRVSADFGGAALPEGSPFPSLRRRRRCIAGTNPGQHRHTRSRRRSPRVGGLRWGRTARGLALPIAARGAAVRRSAALHLRLRGGDRFDHRHPGQPRELEARAGSGAGGSHLVFRSTGVPRLHADSGGRVSCQQRRLPVGTRSATCALSKSSASTGRSMRLLSPS